MDKKLNFYFISLFIIILTTGYFFLNNNYCKSVTAQFKEKSSPLFSFSYHGKVEFMDRYGNVKIKTPFPTVRDFSEGRAAFFDDKTQKWGFIDEKGNVVVKPQYEDEPRPFSCGLSVVYTNNKKYGYIDRNGNYYIKPIYTAAQSFSEGYAAVEVNKKMGYINMKGEMAIKPQFDIALPFHSGAAPIIIKNRYGYINKNGNIIIQPLYKYIGDLSEGLAIEQTEKGLGYINIFGHFAILPSKDYIYYDFSDGVAAFTKRTGKVYNTGLIDKNGNIIIDKVYCKGQYYANVAEFSEGLAAVDVYYKDKDNALYGYINTKGKFVIKPQSLRPSEFKDGLAFLYETIDSKSGVYINKKGEIIRPKGY